MNIDKDQILQFLRDADLLSKLGVDPQQLLGQLGGKLGNIF